MNTTLIAYRRYGEPKLKPLKEMKGAEKIMSLDLRPKRKSQVYLNKETDCVYIHCKDLFSEYKSFPDAEDASMPYIALMNKYPEMKARKVKSFIYADCWTNPILCNEGIIKIEGLLAELNPHTCKMFCKPFLPSIIYRIATDILNFPESNSNGIDDYAAAMDRFIDNIVCYIKTNHYLCNR